MGNLNCMLCKTNETQVHLAINRTVKETLSGPATVSPLAATVDLSKVFEHKYEGLTLIINKHNIILSAHVSGKYNLINDVSNLVGQPLSTLDRVLSISVSAYMLTVAEKAREGSAKGCNISINGANYLLVGYPIDVSGASKSSAVLLIKSPVSDIGVIDNDVF